MKLSILSSFALTATFLVSFRSAAQSCNEKMQIEKLSKCSAVRIIVSTGPGGSADLFARDLQIFLASKKVTAFVDNKVGANGLLATNELLKNNKCDFMMAISGPLVINQLVPDGHTNPEMMKQIKPVGMIASSPLVLAVNTKQMKVNDLQSFVLALKTTHNAPYSSAGEFSGPHLATLLMEQELNLTPQNHIPYKDIAGARTGLQGDQVSFMFDVPAALSTMGKTQNVKVIANTGKSKIEWEGQSIPPMSDLPALKNYSFDSSFGVVTHSKMDPALMSEMQTSLQCLVSQNAFREKYIALGYAIGDGRAASLQTYMNDEPKKLKSLVDLAANANPDIAPRLQKASH